MVDRLENDASSQSIGEISLTLVSLSNGTCTSIWDSTLIGKSSFLRLCQREQLSPQLILEDKVFRLAIRSQHGSTYRSQLHSVGTLIVDDETQRLTFVVDRLQLADAPANGLNHQQLNSEFLIPIRCETRTGPAGQPSGSLLQEGMRVQILQQVSLEIFLSFR